MITIRKAIIKDLEEIKKLNQELFYDSEKFEKTLNLNWPSKNKNYFKKAIIDKDKSAFVAVSDKKIIGYLICVIQKVESYRTLSSIAELENMLVEEEFRGQGIGSMLVKEFIKWAKSKGISKIKVLTYAENSEAIKFYQKNGFESYSLTLEGDI